MQIDPQIAELEAIADQAKLNMAAVLRDAGVHPSTWFRWREKGVEPKVRTLRRVEAAIRQAANPQQDAA